MRFDPYQYPRITLPDESLYADAFFDRSDLKEYIPFTYNINAPIHRWFYFEHGFSSKLIATLLSETKVTKENMLYDPFCGIGTAPVTAIMKGIPSFASDISPFCVFVTNTKLKALNQADNRELQKAIKWFSNNPLPTPSDLPYDDFLKAKLEKVGIDILSLREAIKQFEEGVIKDLCKLALLSIVEYVSRNLIETPPLVQLFNSKLAEMSEDLSNIRDAGNASEFPVAKAIVGDARDLILEKKADIVITSPPYLDFYDYTQKYELEHVLYFASTFEELKEIRYKTIRSHTEANSAISSTYDSDTLGEFLEDNSINNPEHKKLACNYFEDIRLVFGNLSRNILKDGLLFFIVENVEYSNVILEVDTIFAEIATNTGFGLEGILVTDQRKNKRRDSVVVLRKS
jgi:hypothetical protein